MKLQPDIIHLKESNNRTFLHHCAYTGKNEALSLLLEIDCEQINERDDYHYTALILAAIRGHSTSIEVLIQHGADVNIKNSNGNTALIQAADNGRLTSVDILLQHCADANIQNDSGYTALVYAANANHSDCVNMLLQNNADVNLKNSSGQTAYDLATTDVIKNMIKEHSR